MSLPPKARFLDRSTPPHIITLVLLSGLAALAMNVFLPSLPNMALWFGTDYAVMQLSVSLYLAVNAALQIFIGPIADRYGRRPVLLAALILFVLATLGTLLATSAAMFLFFRMCQAVVVAAIVLSRAVVRDIHGEADAASMIGYVTMGMALVPMAAPAIGGVLDQWLGWQANFVLMGVFGLMVLVLAWADLGETTPRRGASFRSQIAEYPELFSSYRFWGYCMAAAFSSGAFFAYLGGAPFVGSVVFGLSPAMLGLFFGAPAVGYAFGNYLSGRYSARVGIDRMVLMGAIICTSGLSVLVVLFAIGLQSAALFFGFFIFVGLGNGMILPNATSGMLSVRPHLSATASGVGGAIMIGFGAALSALAGALLSEGTGPWPMLAIVLATTVCGLGAILLVIRRRRRIGL